MKFLYIGDLQQYPYFNTNISVTDSLGKHPGVQLTTINTHDYFDGSFLSKMEVHFTFPLWHTYRLNRAIIAKAKDLQPDVIYIARGTHILPATLRRLKSICNATIVSYNNDDPFSPAYSTGNRHLQRLWTYFKKTLPLYDINIVFRPHNVADYRQAGARNVHFLPHYFVPADALPAVRPREQIYDVIFIGHYEDDGRADHIRHLLQNGISVKLFGTGWRRDILGDFYPEEITPLYGPEYFQAIKAAKIALVFLSRLNRDVYTYRSYEIPGAGTLMLAPRNEFILTQYTEGLEADYFSTREELLQKVTAYLGDDVKREQLAANGLQRALQSGYDVDSRVRQLLDLISRNK